LTSVKEKVIMSMSTGVMRISEERAGSGQIKPKRMERTRMNDEFFKRLMPIFPVSIGTSDNLLRQ
jgi:hypothetical protein